MQQRSEHLNEDPSAFGPKENRVSTQVDHSLPVSQVARLSPALYLKGAVGSPTQADMASEPAAEKHLVEIAKSLDSQIRAPGMPIGVFDSGNQTANGLVFGS